MKKFAAAWLALLIALVPFPVYAASDFELNLSAALLQRGESLTVSGTASDDASEVIVKIVSPNRTVLYIDVLPVSEGAYSTVVTIPGSPDLAPAGTYQVIAGDGTDSLVRTFAIAGAGGADEGGSGGAQTPVSGDPTGIPRDAGDRTGAAVKPEWAEQGNRYIVGADTLADAMREAADAVAIELPASAGEAGAALEFPASALTELQDQGLGLILTSGGHEIRFPAGSVPASAGASSRVRIVLQTAWTDEAERMVERAIGSDPDYRATGIVLTVLIEIIEGDRSVSVHELDRSAVVRIQLTDEQKRKISSDLAGVYYVNGDGLTYIRGTLEGNAFTFVAEHFSSYTILEYDKTFADMAGHWAEAVVKSLAAKHIVRGVDDRHYEPSRGVTRAEFVTLLMRALEASGHDLGGSRAAQPFADVPADRYYADSVAAAAALGIVTGYEGAFRPADRMTREEAVVSLVRAANTLGLTPPAAVTATAFADAAEIAGWAAAAVDRAQALELIQGDGDKFHPKKTLSRAEIAVMISRLLAASSQV